MKRFFLIISLLSFLTYSLEASDKKLALFNSLDPQSIAQSLAFYELYPSTAEGKRALHRAFALLSPHASQEINQPPLSSSFYHTLQESLPSLTALLNRHQEVEQIAFSEKELKTIETLGSSLGNRILAGHQVQSVEEVLGLSEGQIDLGRALFLAQMGGMSPKVRVYEALLDLMALQILAKLDKRQQADPLDKIRATNHFIFHEMGIRFPPHSLYAEEIDRYTFLPAVLDNHLGVCLGVVTLYLSLAQRIGLPLEIVTPPGHIYVRYRSQEHTINIETTARGINVVSEDYLGLNTRALQLRTLKEVIGMTHVNEASIFLYKSDYAKAVQAYEKACHYMPQDSLVKELLGISYLLINEKEKGEMLLREIADYIPPTAIVASTSIQDYLQGRVTCEDLKAVFVRVDETRESILKKQQSLKAVLKNSPHFREGLLQFAVSFLQLHRNKEAIEILLKYHTIDPSDPTVEYYLAVLHGEQRDYKACWHYLKNAEKITRTKGHSPQALRELRRSLLLHCPE